MCFGKCCFSLKQKLMQTNNVTLFITFQNGLRLTVYLNNYTTFFKDFFNNFKHVPAYELEIFTAALIMKHSEQINYNSVSIRETHLTHPLTGDTSSLPQEDLIIPFYRHLIDLFNTNDKKLDESIRGKIRNDVKMFLLMEFGASGSNTIKTCGDNTKVNQIGIQIFDCIRKVIRIANKEIADLSTKIVDEKTLLEKSKNIQHRYNMKGVLDSLDMVSKYFPWIYDSHINKKYRCFFRGLYPTIAMFQHSTKPNTAIVKLDNGKLGIRAIQKIERGEQIFIPTSFALQHHNSLNDSTEIVCSCLYCLNQFKQLRCLDCPSKVNDSNLFCSSCGFKYTNLNGVYLLLNTIWQKRYDATVDKDNLQFWQCIYEANLEIVSTIFVPDNIFVYNAEKMLFAVLAKNGEFFPLHKKHLDQIHQKYKNLKRLVDKHYPAKSIVIYHEYCDLYECLFEVLENNHQTISEDILNILLQFHELCKDIYIELIEISRTHKIICKFDFSKLKKIQESLLNNLIATYVK